MKNENHEKLIFFEVLEQFRGFHPTPEVKICLYTKFEVHRRELEKIEILKIASKWPGWPCTSVEKLPSPRGPPREQTQKQNWVSVGRSREGACFAEKSKTPTHWVGGLISTRKRERERGTHDRF